MFRSFDLYKMVKDHGEPLVLQKITTEGSYDATIGTILGSATTNYNILGYLYNYSNGLMSVDQDVRFGTRKCLISAVGLTVEPDTGDLISGNGDTVKVTSTTSIYSNGAVLCYICDVKE